MTAITNTARLRTFSAVFSGVLWGIGLAALGPLATPWGLISQARAAAPVVAPLETLAPGVQVDWNRGVLLAAGSCAADLVAASADVARVKAERLARSRAEARLRRALQMLSRETRLRGKVAPEVLAQLEPAQAKVAHIEYAATGSVSLQLELALAAPAPAPAKAGPVASEAHDGGGGGGPGSAGEGDKAP